MEPEQRKWVSHALNLKEQLPGKWTVRGHDYLILLVREPVDWTVPWIGFDSGRVSAAVQPLMQAFTGWSLRYGTSTDDAAQGLRRIDADTPDALDKIKDFIFGHGLKKIEDWPLQRIADVAEIDFADSYAEREHFWLAAPGCRLILDSASPEQPALELIEHCEKLGATANKAFYTELLTAWHSTGREGAMNFLYQHRRNIFEEEGLEIFHN